MTPEPNSDRQHLTDLEFQPVTSSNVAAIAYSPETRKLHVRFRDQKVYEYVDISPDQHAVLMNAPSIGRHLAQKLGKGRLVRTEVG